MRHSQTYEKSFSLVCVETAHTTSQLTPHRSHWSQNITYSNA